MGASPTTGSITVTVTGNTNPVGVIASSFSGVDTSGTDGSGAVEASTETGGPAVDDNDMLLSVTTITANALAWGAGTYRSGLFTVPASQTIIQDDLAPGGAGGTEANSSTWYAGPVVTPAATDVGEANDLNTARDWSMIAVSIKPASTAGPAGGDLIPLRFPNRNVGPAVSRFLWRQPFIPALQDPAPTTTVLPPTVTVDVAVPTPTIFVTAKPSVATVTVAAYDALPTTETPIELSISWADTTVDFIDHVKVGTLNIKTNTDRRNGTLDVVLVGQPADFDLFGSGGLAVEAFVEFQYGVDILFSGKLRSVKPRDVSEGNIELALACQDKTYLAYDDVVDPTIESGTRTTVESDSTRLQWLIDTFGTNWQSLGGFDPETTGTFVPAMPAQDFTGMSLAQAFDEICKFSGADWYVNFSGNLVYYKPGISYVQRVASRGSSSAATTLVATLGSITTTVGHHLILQAVGGAIISSVADSKGNTWQVDKTDASGTERPSIASSKLTTALIAADTITVTWASSNQGAFVVDEFTGLNATTWFDKGHGASGTSTSSDSGATAATTNRHTTLVVGATGHASTVTNFAMETLLPPWTATTSAASTGTVHTIRGAYRFAYDGPLTYNAIATWTTSRAWGAAVATYKEATTDAPFGLSDAPDGSLTFGYQNLVIDQESTELRNKVVVIGGSGYEDLFTDDTSRGLYNDVGRTGVIKDTNITNATDGALAASAYFLENAYHKTQGSLITFRSGLVPGMDVDVTSANQLLGQFGWNVGTTTFRVQTVTTMYPRIGEISYAVGFGTVPRRLAEAIRDTAVSQTEVSNIVAGILRGYIGEVIMWPLSTPPTGFILCDGSSLTRTGTYAALFSVLGTTFGSADGSHFNVPDMTDRFVVGVGAAALGATGGNSSHTHTGPSHTHTGPSHTHDQTTHTHSLSSDGFAMTTLSLAGQNLLQRRISTSAWTTTVKGDTPTTSADSTGGIANGVELGGNTDSSGDDTTTAGGTGASGSGGTGATGSGTHTPPYIALYYVIRYA
jgi:microcystin-dependent protein